MDRPLDPESSEPSAVSIDNGKNRKQKSGKEKKKRGNPVFLFRYASCLDYLFLLVGTLAAIAQGASLPLLLFFFGNLTNIFIFESVSSTIARNLSETFNMAVDCNTVIQTGSVNISITSVIEQEFDSAVCVLGDSFIERINYVVFILIGISVMVWMGAYAQVGFFRASAERQVQKIRLCYYQAVLKQDIAWFDAHPSGELANRISDDIEKVHDGIGEKISSFVRAISTFITGFAVAFSQEWRLTLFLLGFMPFIVIVIAIVAVVTTTVANKEQTEYASAGAIAEEVLSSIRTVIAFGGEAHEIDRYNTKLKRAKRFGCFKGFAFGLAFGLVFFLIFFMYGCSFWFGGFLIATHGVGGGSILGVFFSAFVGGVFIGRAGPELEALLTAAGSAEEIYKTIERTPPIDSSSEVGLQPEKFEPTVELRNVKFSYPARPDIQVLFGINLKVEVGQTLALVGPTGCGKSTIIQLIERFYDLQGDKSFLDVGNGQVLVGGKDIRDLNIKWLRRQIGLVSQEPVLFNTTIAENIRYGKEDATIEEIEEAARKANAHNFVSELPKGYSTIVGEGGTQLSGGQKQRVAIARALISNPTILLLDEATSALDSQSESAVQKALDRACLGRTTIVIAHRLSTIKGADRIAAMENGKIVETGTHDELMATKSLYCQLVTAQSFETDEVFFESGAIMSNKQRVIKSSNGLSDSELVTYRNGDGKLAPTAKEDKGSTTAEEDRDKDIPRVSIFRVLALNAKEWWLILIGVIASALSGIIYPLSGLLFGEVLRVFSLPNTELIREINVWGGYLIGIGAVAGVGLFVKTITFTLAGENLTARLRALSFKAMLRQEIGWFDEERNSTGALVTRLSNDAAQVQAATGSRIGTIIETFVGLILALAIAFAYSWILTIVVLMIIPLMIIAGIINVQTASSRAAKDKMNLETAGRLVVESTVHIRTVASLTAENNFYMQYKTQLLIPYRFAVYMYPVAYGFTFAFSQAIMYMMFAIVFRFGAFQIVSDNPIIHEEFQDVFRTFSALIFGAFSLAQASSYAPNYTRARISANRIFSLLDRQPTIDNYKEDGQKLEKVSGYLSIDEVFFSYPARPDVEVLKGVNLSVKSGKTLAIVGASGCGKSTIVQLVDRFYDPSEGSLKLEGVDVRDLNLHWLRSQIGTVSQEPVLFDGTIANNIRYGALFRDVSDEEIIVAAKSANIHSFIETLPMGYKTNVGAKGTQLSGGQKQRVAIARALIRDPKVLLLDEATSALDTESEKVVQEALDKAREGRTSIVIAHRLSTIYNSDCIAVIKDGKVFEAGTHAELLTEKGLYYKLNQFQALTAKHATDLN